MNIRSGLLIVAILAGLGVLLHAGSRCLADSTSAPNSPNMTKWGPKLTPEEEAMSHPSGLLHRLHRKLTKPYRAVRRAFLGWRYRQGLLASPTAELEDHLQPEKDSWRKDQAQP